MYISHDYSYVNKTLVDLGYAKIGIHSLNFDRYFSEKEKEENRKAYEILDSDGWSKRCDQISKELFERMESMMKILNNKYSIYQYNNTIKYGEHDLFFYSNRGWNNKEWYDYIQLSFNEKNGYEYNNMLLSELLDLISILELKNVYCRVQYETIVDEKKLHDDVLQICEQYEGKFITYSGMVGKIKCVNIKDDQKEYGFFKKGAKNRYYRINDAELIKLKIA